MRLLRHMWRLLRWWSGDDAYERYLAEHRKHSAGRHDAGMRNQHGLDKDKGKSGVCTCSQEPLTRREFYKWYFAQRSDKPRCC
jgi:hypothetical protein